MRKSPFVFSALLALSFWSCAPRSRNIIPVNNAAVDYKVIYEDTIAFHRNAQSHLLENHLLILSWYPKGETKTQELYILDSWGKVSIYKSIRLIESGNKEEYRLEGKVLSDIKNNLDLIPGDKKAKVRTNSVIFSYRNRASWETREFDRSNLPGEVKRIIDKLELNNFFK